MNLATQILKDLTQLKSMRSHFFSMLLCQRFLTDQLIEAKAERKDFFVQETANAEVMNKRIQTLMDGYEQRIGDLTNEVHGLREEVKSLRKALDQRARMCLGCPRAIEMEALFHLQDQELKNTP